MTLINQNRPNEKWAVNILQYRIECVKLINGFYSEREIFRNCNEFIEWCYKMDTAGWVYE